MNSKYAPLQVHLRDSGRAHLAMTFGEIERVIGAALPPAARKHRALWSNNPSNGVMTKAWLAAGYETEKVDMQKHSLVFRRVVGSAPPGGADETPAAERPGSFAEVFGKLHDTVTIAPGTDLTDPVDEDWNAER